MTCIGYIGVEAFDIILYIAKSICMLNIPVLIVDISGTDALAQTIYHGMDLDSKENIVQYRSLNYIRRIPDAKELKAFEEGVIFVVYGFCYNESISFHHPDFLNIIVNPFPHNLQKVNHIMSHFSSSPINIKLIVRDIVTIDDFDRVRRSMASGIKPYKSMYLYYDLDDYENAMQCQILQVIRFKKISLGMKRLIMAELGDILPKIKPESRRKAFCLARKGDNHR